MKALLTFILAGGKGERLQPLTLSRSKLILPFLGSRRLIDFTLFNCSRSGIFHLWTLTCNAAFQMDLTTQQSRKEGHSHLISRMDGKAWTQALNEPGYDGTADAVRQNLSKISKDVDEVLILAGDHIYSMDYRKILAFHRQKGAMATVGTTDVDWEEAKHFGLVALDGEDRVIGFCEKPKSTKALEAHSPKAHASMGIYVFNADFLSSVLQTSSGNDFGHDLLPELLNSGNVFAFNTSVLKGGHVQWRDVGTIDAYWQSQIEILKERPELSLSKPATEDDETRFWGSLTPLRSTSAIGGPRDVEPLVCGQVVHSALSRGVLVHSGAEITESILLEGAVIGPGARIRRTIVDRGVVVPARARIGFDRANDEECYLVSEGGIVVLTKERIALGKKEGYHSFAPTKPLEPTELFLG
jgi:glucose-1-phosphate adenylyltransferase